MRISICKTGMGLAFLCMAPLAALAEEKSYVCAINEVYDCVAVTGCSRISSVRRKCPGHYGGRYREEAAPLDAHRRRT